MMSRKCLLAILVSAVVLWPPSAAELAWAQDSDAATVVIDGGLLIDGTGASPRQIRALVIEGDRIKEIVPIWKKEHFEGGEIWVGCQTSHPPQAHPGHGHHDH